MRKTTKMFHYNETVAVTDPEVWQAVASEMQRQEQHIELIASENYASPAVMQAQGSQLTNATTAAASTSTSSSASPSNAPRSSFASPRAWK